MARAPSSVTASWPLGPASALTYPLSTSSLFNLSHKALCCGLPSGSRPACCPTEETAAVLPTPTQPATSYNATKKPLTQLLQALRRLARHVCAPPWVACQTQIGSAQV